MLTRLRFGTIATAGFTLTTDEVVRITFVVPAGGFLKINGTTICIGDSAEDTVIPIGNGSNCFVDDYDLTGSDADVSWILEYNTK